VEYKEFLKWPLVILPGGGLLLGAFYLYQNYGPGAVMTNENGQAVDFTLHSPTGASNMVKALLLLLTLSVPCFADTPFDSSHDFELFTCNAFLACSLPAAVEVNGCEWNPNFLLWPLTVLGWDFLYRLGENNRHSWNEFETLDLPGVLLGTAVMTPIFEARF
jgi:hypothetical protein